MPSRTRTFKFLHGEQWFAGGLKAAYIADGRSSFGQIPVVFADGLQMTQSY